MVKMKSTIDLMLNWDLFENKKIIWLRQMISAIFIGAAGTLIILMFLATIMPLFKAVNFIPWLIGFNTAMTGYSVVEKTRASLKNRHMVSIGAGLLNVLITASILIVLSIYTFGANLFGPVDLLIFFIIGAVCSWIGAWLAVKYFK
jgi:hypothetical protein